MMHICGVNRRLCQMLKFNKQTSAENIKTGSESAFAADVIEASRNVPVIAYFSASWCGPCKTFGPELEKAVRDSGGAVTLVKFDVDNCQRLAAQLGVQSVPTVFGFADGRPVDAVMGAQPASQIKAFVGKLAKMGKSDDIAAEVEEAENLLASGAAVDAAQRFAAILSDTPDNAAALGGMSRAYLALGNLDSAEAILNSAPAEIAESQEVLAAKASVDLARQAVAAGPVGELRSKVSADPEDHQSRLELAVALHADGQNEAAVNELLELFRRDREWRDGAARAQLLKIFDTLKPNDPVALKGRRRFSSMVFS